MVTLKKYQNKKIAVYGMGLTGCSVAKTLKKLGGKIFCWDDDVKIRKKVKKLNFPLNKFWLKQNFVDNIVISPGIDINRCKIKNYLRKNLNKIITDLDLFFDLNKDCMIISITGTNGKSTTCKIIEKILKTAKYNVKTVGNIGNPILYSINSKKDHMGRTVCELANILYNRSEEWLNVYKGYHVGVIWNTNDIHDVCLLVLLECVVLHLLNVCCI